MSDTITRFQMTSKDIAIARQHFSNDLIIGYLWGVFKESKERKDLSPFYKALAEVESFLDECVILTYKKPSDELIKGLSGEVLREDNGDITPFK